MADVPNAAVPAAAPAKKPAHLRLVQATLAGGEATDTTLVFHPNHGELAMLDNAQFAQLDAAIRGKYGKTFSLADAEHCQFAFDQAKALAGSKVFTNEQLDAISHAVGRVLTIGSWEMWI